jgi:hypothetical protein
VRRGSRVHGVVLAPGGRRVEVRIVIHLSHGKRPSADSGGEGDEAGAREAGAAATERAGVSGRERALAKARLRETRVGEPSGAACVCLREIRRRDSPIFQASKPANFFRVTLARVDEGNDGLTRG